jgi:predicted Zn-ribbon and HTH transcriptional regulator
LIDNNTFLEEIWSALLSRDQDEIKRIYHLLGKTSREVVLEHLKKMASEPGWHPEQVISAQKALQAIGNEDNGNEYSPVN